MKNRIIAILLLTLAAFTLLTGCMRSGVDVCINADGTGSVGVAFGINENYYNSILEYGESPFEGKETVLLQDGDNTYVCVVENTEYSSYEEIEAALLALEYNTDLYDIPDEDEIPIDSDAVLPETVAEVTEPAADSEVTEDLHIFKDVSISRKSGVFYNSYTFKASLNPQSVSGYEDILQGVGINDVYKVALTVTLPDKITKAEGGEIDGKTVRFVVDDITEETDFVVQSEATNYIVIIGAIAVLVLTIIIFLLLSKKKNT